MSSEISKEMFYTWKNDPVTLEVVKALFARRQYHSECLINPDFLLYPEYGRQSARIVGAINEIDVLLKMDYSDLSEEEEVQDGK